MNCRRRNCPVPALIEKPGTLKLVKKGPRVSHDATSMLANSANSPNISDVPKLARRDFEASREGLQAQRPGSPDRNSEEARKQRQVGRQ